MLFEINYTRAFFQELSERRLKELKVTSAKNYKVMKMKKTKNYINVFSFFSLFLIKKNFLFLMNADIIRTDITFISNK